MAKSSLESLVINFLFYSFSRMKSCLKCQREDSTSRSNQNNYPQEFIITHNEEIPLILKIYILWIAFILVNWILLFFWYLMSEEIEDSHQNEESNSRLEPGFL